MMRNLKPIYIPWKPMTLQKHQLSQWLMDATIKKEILAQQVEQLYLLWPGPATTAPLRPPGWAGAWQPGGGEAQPGPSTPSSLHLLQLLLPVGGDLAGDTTEHHLLPLPTQSPYTENNRPGPGCGRKCFVVVGMLSTVRRRSPCCPRRECTKFSVTSLTRSA